MQCPACTAAMTALTLDGHLGTTVDLDLCATCQVIWFDRLESLRLSPGATLSLFRTIGERKQLSPPPLADPLKCPRCDLRLLLTNDRQRNTPFRYRRCARDHGRLITFFDFLREKDFVRPLSARQLAELRANVQIDQLLELRRAGRSDARVRLRALQHAAVHAGPESDRRNGRAPAAGRRGIAKDRSDAARAHEAREGGGRFALRGAARGRAPAPGRRLRAWSRWGCGCSRSCSTSCVTPEDAHGSRPALSRSDARLDSLDATEPRSALTSTL